MPAATTSPSVRTVRQPSPSVRTVSLFLSVRRLDVQGEALTSWFLVRPPFPAYRRSLLRVSFRGRETERGRRPQPGVSSVAHKDTGSVTRVGGPAASRGGAPALPPGPGSWTSPCTEQPAVPGWRKRDEQADVPTGGSSRLRRSAVWAAGPASPWSPGIPHQRGEPWTSHRGKRVLLGLPVAGARGCGGW